MGMKMWKRGENISEDSPKSKKKQKKKLGRPSGNRSQDKPNQEGAFKVDQ